MALPGRSSRPLTALACACLLLAGCSLGNDAAGGGSSSAPSSRRVHVAAVHNVAVGRHEVATRCAGDASKPSVLLVAGYDTAMQSAWDDVQARIGTFSRVCAYDRLGVGGSDNPPRRQTFADMADDLDAVLQALQLKRPVVLVAHSLGGIVAATWAEAHRKAVAGLVFVDATPPSFVQLVLNKLPADPAARGGSVRAGITTLLAPRRNVEHLDGAAAFQGPTTLSPIGSVPVVALSHTISDWGDVTRRQGAELDSAWLGGQQRWSELSSQGRVQLVDLAGHFIQRDQPTAVVDTVREVVRGGGAG
jgi:pimeloyl-ACP methyl ester carboxylesterase